MDRFKAMLVLSNNVNIRSRSSSSIRPKKLGFHFHIEDIVPNLIQTTANHIRFRLV